MGRKRSQSRLPASGQRPLGLCDFSHRAPLAVMISRSAVTYALPGAEFGNTGMAENWRAQHGENGHSDHWEISVSLHL